MIMQLLNKMKEISNVNMTQSVKLVPVFTCDSETNTNNVSDIKTNVKC